MLQRNKLVACTLVVSFLMGCSAARQGATEKGFIATGIVNPIEINVTPPLALVSAGKQKGKITTDTTFSPSVTMRYAVFASPKNQETQQYAHIFIATLPSETWKFSMESWERPSSLELSKRSLAERNFTVQTFIITDTNDWFSQLWEKNAGIYSSAWIARRFSSTPKTSVRIVAEYREPASECVKNYIPQDTGQTEVRFSSAERQIIWGNCFKELSAFTERSDAAFTIEKPKETQVIKETTPLQLPTIRPDISKLAGEAEYIISTPRL